MDNIFATADQHFSHKNIIQYESRPFQNIDEMDKFMIRAWNEVVPRVGTVFHLGDVSFTSKNLTQYIISQLNGNKILIRGNHDRGRSKQWFLDVGFKEVIDYPIIFEEFFILSHEPVYLNATMPYCNLHGHLHHKTLSGAGYYNVGVDVRDYKPVSFEEIRGVFVKKSCVFVKKSDDLEAENG